ncbi:MAG TPA: TonB-dependent receptor plug domain-containing protein, partial [Acidobacteriota bacterium]|nr:TonB-dependent receptor plug domain-containing protein [Acidobacteriota bacterium]
MQRITLFLFSLFLLTIAVRVFAQETQTGDQSTEQPTYQVTVTGDRLEEPISDKSDSVTVITREQIEAHQWHYVIDAIRQAPGVTLLQSGSPGKV